MAENENSITFSITIPTVVHDKLMEQAEKLKLNRSAYVRFILMKFVEEKKED